MDFRRPALEELAGVFVVAGLGPAFVDVALVFVREDPRELFAVLDGSGQEVDVRAEPAGVGVAVDDEVFGEVILGELRRVHPCALDGVAARFGVVIVAEDECAGFTSYTVCA